MVDHGSAIAPYIQLAAILRARIADGTYAPGSRMPSAEGLAQEYEIAVNTARKALKLLTDEGIAVMSPGRGTYVRAADLGQRSRPWPPVVKPCAPGPSMLSACAR